MYLCKSRFDNNFKIKSIVEDNNYKLLPQIKSIIQPKSIFTHKQK